MQELCEGACVLGAEHKPIMIGRLQRYAMDHVYDTAIDVVPAAGAADRHTRRRDRRRSRRALLRG